MTPTYKRVSGEVRVIDLRNFPASTTISAARVILKPGALRELHWHQNADEWQYYVQGEGRMTVFFNGAKARSADFRAGDVGYVPQDPRPIHREHWQHRLDLPRNVQSQPL